MLYKNRPDVLDLVVRIEDYDDLKVQQLETESGLSEALYLFKGNLLLGVVTNFPEYYNRLGVETSGRISASLVPTLRDCDATEVPSLDGVLHLPEVCHE